MGTCYTLAPGTCILERAVILIAGNFVLRPREQNWGAINVGQTLNEVLTWRWQWTLPVTASTHNLRLVTAIGSCLFVLLPINNRRCNLHGWLNNLNSSTLELTGDHLQSLQSWVVLGSCWHRNSTCKSAYNATDQLKLWRPKKDKCNSTLKWAHLYFFVAFLWSLKPRPKTLSAIHTLTSLESSDFCQVGFTPMGIVTSHVSDVMDVIVLTSSVRLSVCPSHYPGRTDGHINLNFGMEVKW